MSEKHQRTPVEVLRSKWTWAFLVSVFGCAVATSFLATIHEAKKPSVVQAPCAGGTQLTFFQVENLGGQTAFTTNPYDGIHTIQAHAFPSDKFPVIQTVEFREAPYYTIDEDPDSLPQGVWVDTVPHNGSDSLIVNGHSVYSTRALYARSQVQLCELNGALFEK